MILLFKKFTVEEKKIAVDYQSYLYTNDKPLPELLPMFSLIGGNNLWTYVHGKNNKELISLSLKLHAVKFK